MNKKPIIGIIGYIEKTQNLTTKNIDIKETVDEYLRESVVSSGGIPISIMPTQNIMYNPETRPGAIERLTEEEITKTMSANVKIGTNPFIRPVPLFIKKVLVRLSYIEIRKYTTITFSNIEIPVYCTIDFIEGHDVIMLVEGGTIIGENSKTLKTSETETTFTVNHDTTSPVASNTIECTGGANGEINDNNSNNDFKCLSR